MTGTEIVALTTLIGTCGGLLLGMWRVVATQASASRAMVVDNAKRRSDPPQDHGPCNASVDRLTDALHEEIKEQQAFRLSFEKWMAAEDGYRRGLRATGEFPVPE